MTSPDMFKHAPSDHITRGQFCLLRLINVHKAFFMHIQKSSPITTTTFSDQNFSGHNAGGMKLNGFRITNGHQSCVQGHGCCPAITNYGIGGGCIQTTKTTTTNGCSCSQIGLQPAGAQTTHHCTHTFLTIVNQGNGFLAI